MSLKQISQNTSLVENLFGTAADMGAALLNEQDWFDNDSLVEKIPYGKIVAWFIKKTVIINDVDEAFNHAYTMAYFICFAKAVSQYKVFLKGTDLVEIKSEKQSEPFFPLGNGELIEEAIYGHYANKYANLLSHCKVADKTTNTILNYIRCNLKIVFHELLENKPITYKTLCEELDKTSFSLRNEKLRITQYYQEQKNLYLLPVMGDDRGMTLSDVYVKPEYRIHKICIGGNNFGKDFKESEYSDPERNSVKVFVEPKTKEYNTIHELLGDFVSDSSIKDKIKYPATNILVLLGYPGQGKTSCIRRLLFDLIKDAENQELPIYHLPLRTIENVPNFCNAPFEVIEEHIKERNLPDIYSKEIVQKGIIILEGLDELAIQSGTKEKTIDDVVKELLRVQENRSMVKLIITSRLGYLDCEQFKKKNLLIVQLKEFNVVQQIEWLGKYRRFYPECEINSNDIQNYNQKGHHLKELINQPILLHMVVTSGLKTTSDANRAKLYETLFTSLIDRKWANNEQIEILGGFDTEDLREIIQDMALAIYHSGRNCIQKRKIEELDAVKRHIIQKLGFDKLGGALKGVMVSFYFQEVEQKEENGTPDFGIEFLHKSLSEYMAAEKIWKEIKNFLEQRSAGRRYIIDSFEDALKLLNQLFAPQMLTLEVRNYIWEIMENDLDFNAEKLSERLSFFFPDLLRKEFLWDYNAGKQDLPVKRALHTFYGYWTVLSQLAEKLQHDYLNKENRSEFLHLLRSCLLNPLPPVSLNYQNLSMADLSGADLSGADLSGADLTGVKLTGAKLYQTYLSGAILLNANLSGANLFGAILSEADLSGADLSRADLSKVNLSKSNLSRANLSGANLSEANLSGANLERAILERAILTGVKLSNANFSGCFLDQQNYLYFKEKGIDVTGMRIKEISK